MKTHQLLFEYIVLPMLWVGGVFSCWYFSPLEEGLPYKVILWAALSLVGIFSVAFFKEWRRQLGLYRSGFLPAKGSATIEDVQRLLRANEMAYAMGCYQEIHHCGLMEAKKAIDELRQLEKQKVAISGRNSFLLGMKSPKVKLWFGLITYMLLAAIFIGWNMRRIIHGELTLMDEHFIIILETYLIPFAYLIGRKGLNKTS